MSKKITIERRTENILIWRIVAYITAIGFSLLVTSTLLYTARLDVFETYQVLFEGALGGRDEILETLVRATPLILTGLATVIAFRARIWSIGQEGQLVTGAVIAFLASTIFDGLPAFILIPIVMLFGFLGGGALGALCGWLKSRFDVDEIISTVMFNYIVYYMLNYLLSGPIQDPTAGTYHLQTAVVTEAARLPLLVEDTRFTAGFFIATVIAIIVSFIIKKTSLGYDIRALGFNPRACKFKGMNIPTMFVIVMAISGGCAGLAGTIEVFGANTRIDHNLLSNFGYTGILVALIGGLTPLGTVLAAIVFGGLMNGGLIVQVLLGVPNSIITAIQGIVVIFVLAASLLTQFKISRIENSG